MTEPFPAWHHWALLSWVEDPEVAVPLAAWNSLKADVIQVAARTFCSWGKESKWPTPEKAEGFFLEALMTPPLRWAREEPESAKKISAAKDAGVGEPKAPKMRRAAKFERIEFAEVKPGHLSFELWKAQRRPASRQDLPGGGAEEPIRSGADEMGEMGR